MLGCWQVPEVYIYSRLVKKKRYRHMFPIKISLQLAFCSPPQGWRTLLICYAILLHAQPGAVSVCPHLVFGLQAPWSRAGHDFTAPGMTGPESPVEAHSLPQHILWPRRSSQLCVGYASLGQLGLLLLRLRGSFQKLFTSLFQAQAPKCPLKFSLWCVCDIFIKHPFICLRGTFPNFKMK